MPNINVSVGELIDKLSILEIKLEKGLEVNIEYKQLNKSYSQFYQGVINDSLYTLLKDINAQLWIIEDKKRNFEKNNCFENEFIAYARLVYILNDQRASVKRLLDNINNSHIKEMKSHDGDT